MTTAQKAMVNRIRRALALRLDLPLGYRFLNLLYRPGESADDALLRLFREESDAQRRRTGHHPEFDRVVEAMCAEVG